MLTLALIYSSLRFSPIPREALFLCSYIKSSQPDIFGGIVTALPFKAEKSRM